MSKNNKRNYTQYSNNKKPSEATEAVKAVVEATDPEIKLVKETVSTVAIPKMVKGTIINCAKLNIRVAPNIEATVACVLPVDTQLEINVTNSTDEWFNVITAAGVEGYCMKRFIKIAL